MMLRLRARRAGSALALLVLLGLAAGGLQGQTLSLGTAVPQVTLDPDAKTYSTGALRVSGNKQYAGAFTVVVTATAFSPAPAPDPIRWGIWTDPLDAATALNIVDAAPASGVLSGSLKNQNQSVTISISAVVLPGSLPAPGTYIANLRASLHQGSTLPPSGSAVATLDFTVPIVVASSTSIAVVQTGGSYSPGAASATLDFGDLSAPSSRALDIIARCNVGWSLSLVSSKGWVLDSLDEPGVSKVPYAIKVDGTSRYPVPGSALALGSGAATGMSGRRLSLQFTPTPGLYPMAQGSYIETLTLSIASP